MKTNFEVVKYQDSKKIVSKDSYLSMQAIGKTDTKKILYYYALSKIHLRKHKSYFKFIILLSGDINLNPRPYTDVNPFSNNSLGDINLNPGSYTDSIPFCNSCSSINYSWISLASNDEDSNIEK